MNGHKREIGSGDIAFIESDTPGFWEIHILNRKISDKDNIVFEKVADIRHDALRRLAKLMVEKLL